MRRRTVDVVEMASSMGGMFPGQQPPGPHQPTGPGGPGQPGLLTGPPGNRGANNTLVDELEASFEVRIFRKPVLFTRHASDGKLMYCRMPVSGQTSTDFIRFEPSLIIKVNHLNTFLRVGLFYLLCCR